jgi:hypothetical protein
LEHNFKLPFSASSRQTEIQIQCTADLTVDKLFTRMINEKLDKLSVFYNDPNQNANASAYKSSLRNNH